MDQQTSPPSAIYPTPQDQVSPQSPVQNQIPPSDQRPAQSEQPNPTPPHKNNTLKIVLIALGSCLVLTAIIVLIVVLMIRAGLKGAQSNANDEKIKSSLSSLQAGITVYYDEHQSYKGFTPDDYTNQQVQTAGSKITVQGLNDRTYVIYAQLPSSKKIWCLDNSGFEGEINNVQPQATSCR